MSEEGFKITSIIEPPVCLPAQEHDAATSSTPASFASIPPKLVLALQEVSIYAEPAFDSLTNGQGSIWVTEQSFSFLSSSSSSTGFSLPYPLLALHAVSSSLPPALAQQGERPCIYCQIEDASLGAEDGEGEDNGNEEEETGLREMWIIPKNTEDVEPLFAALSHCASLHPSTSDGDDDGNPFASLGPFGTGIGGSSGADGAFDDAEEGEEPGGGLSETGRTQLARMEAMLSTSDDRDEDSERWTDAVEDEPLQEVQPTGPQTNVVQTRRTAYEGVDEQSEQRSLERPSTPEELQAQGSSSAADDTSYNTNLLLLSSYPIPLPSLFSAPLLQSLLALLDAYSPIIGWDPHPEEGQMRVVFDDRQLQGRDSASSATGVQRIISILNDLPLETEEAHASVKPTLRIQPLPRIDTTSLLPRQLTNALPSLAAPATSSSMYAPTDHLLPPSTDRNFLISPPGSPPIGWEPIREDPPNRETLAGDLMEALRKLGREMEEAGVPKADLSGSSLDSMAPPQAIRPGEVQVVVPANGHRRLPSVVDSEDFPPIPSVTVQAFDEQDGQNEVASANKPDITQVKATVESMRGDTMLSSTDAEQSGLSGGGKRITPTGRPPLA